MVKITQLKKNKWIETASTSKIHWIIQLSRLLTIVKQRKNYWKLFTKVIPAIKINSERFHYGGNKTNDSFEIDIFKITIEKHDHTYIWNQFITKIPTIENICFNGSWWPCHLYQSTLSWERPFKKKRICKS